MQKRMISLSQNGVVAAMCRDGRVLLVSNTARYEQPTGENALVLAFDDQVWLVEGIGPDIRVRRLSLDGEVLGEQHVRDAGTAVYVHMMSSVRPTAVIGGHKRTVIIRLDAGSMIVSDVRSPPDRVVPARSLVMVTKGDAWVGQAKSGRKLNREELRVSRGWSLVDGSVVALFGRDGRGMSVDFVGMKRGIIHARLRVEPDVIVAAAPRSGRLILVHDRTLTVFDVVARRNVLKKSFKLPPVDVAVDGEGERAVIETYSGTIDFIELSSNANHERAYSDISSTLARAPTSDGAPKKHAARVVGAPSTRAESSADGRTPASRSAAPREAGVLLAGGRFIPCRDPRGQIESRSPSDPDDVIGVFPYGVEDVAIAATAASDAAAEWTRMRLDERAVALRSFDEEIRARSATLIGTMERETGRPHWECSREVLGLSYRLDHTLSVASTALDERVDRVSAGRVSSRPLGVVAVIGPAMFPLATSHQHLMAALAAGNTVVWKPSPLCTATAQLYAEALCASHLPPGVINVIAGGGDVGAELMARPEVACVVLTGSVQTGRAARERPTDRLGQKQIYHLGAKNAAVVLANSTLELAAYEIATSAFMSAGQRCTSISRVFVEREVVDEFIGTLLPICESFQIGPPGTQSFFGPMLSRERRDRFLAVLDAAPKDGATAIMRESVPVDMPGYFVRPSVHLVEGAHSGGVYQDEELFGPDLAVHPVSGLDEAIRLCNDSHYGLCCNLFTEDSRMWERFTREVEVGTVLLNMGTHSVSGRLPFGGVKASGHGGRAGADAILALRREISIQERRSDVVDIWPGTSSPESDTSS